VILQELEAVQRIPDRCSEIVAGLPLSLHRLGLLCNACWDGILPLRWKAPLGKRDSRTKRAEPIALYPRLDYRLQEWIALGFLPYADPHLEWARRVTVCSSVARGGR
jgi:hypothetical protein